MAKPSTSNSAGILGIHLSDNVVDLESKVTYTKAISKVFLQSLHDARLVYTGQTSGKQYIWGTAGSIVEVDTEDSEILLAKRIYGSCCGNSRDGRAIFQIFN